jgi:hypothetical protein
VRAKRSSNPLTKLFPVYMAMVPSVNATVMLLILYERGSDVQTMHSRRLGFKLVGGYAADKVSLALRRMRHMFESRFLLAAS